MTPQEIRIAVAEEMGKCMSTTFDCDHECTVCFAKRYDNIHDFPDYPFDLNAMREVEETLDDLERREYTGRLAHLIGYKTSDDQYNFIHATALQRAEAFLFVKRKGRE